ncbi:hypothetical protein DRJ17_02180 [Candidatus Woesearchaeota archaeon]|nr:MAG: hypothetical protein DRJ17_02180 [Candidatus Woesearchaeota archaeon]
MIVNKDFLNKLKDFGLNSYESKLWTALLSRGVATAGELSDIANVPRSRSYDVLESLERKGFIIMKLGKPIKYIAVSPAEVLDRVQKKINQEAERQTKNLDKLKESEVLAELNILHNQGIEHVEPTELSGCVKGRHNIYSHLDAMIKGAEKNVFIVTTTNGFIRKAETLKRAMKKAKDRGIKIKIAAPITKECLPYIKDISAYAEIRNTNNTNIKARFCIVDDKELMFMLLDDVKVHSTYDVGVWVNTPIFTKTIVNFLKTAWEKMKPVQQTIKAK